jgi:parallel beta-helix repeat protein
LELKKIVLLTVILILFSIAVIVRFIRPVSAGGTITIKADGSVDPPTAPISTVDNVTYTFTDNIYGEIVVEKDNIVVDGAGYTVQGTGKGSGSGIYLSGRSNVTVKNVEVKEFYLGICLYSYCNNNTVFGNTASNNTYGVYLDSYCNNNIISGNTASNNDDGIVLTLHSSNNSLFRNTAISNGFGIGIGQSSNNIISGNNIKNNIYGVTITDSSNNIISGNNIGWCSHVWACGISLFRSSDNSILGNTITENNNWGIYLYMSSDNTIYHNNFINNTNQVYISDSLNLWDGGYPSGGNYWSNYTGVDSNHDGIGDSPHVLDGNNTDNFPLMGMFYDFAVEIEWGQICHIYVISNSTVSGFEGVCLWLTSANEYLQPGQPLIHLYVTGEEDSVGFCRIMIPRVAPLNNSYVVLVWSEYQLGHWKLVEIPSTELPTSNTTHAYIYFTYTHPLIFDEITVTIPEFPTWTSMLLVLIIVTVAITIYKRRILK